MWYKKDKLNNKEKYKKKWDEQNKKRKEIKSKWYQVNKNRIIKNTLEKRRESIDVKINHSVGNGIRKSLKKMPNKDASKPSILQKELIPDEPQEEEEEEEQNVKIVKKEKKKKSKKPIVIVEESDSDSDDIKF